MANQPKKYKKFVATAATATLVASAIVPVASAAEFTDVGNLHPATKAELDRAVELGLMTGIGSKFQPNSSITRGQVAKALAKYIAGQEDLTIKEYFLKYDLADTVEPFSDVPANSKDAELYQASLIVKDAEVFSGANNKLSPTANIQRQHMAKVVVNAFGLEGNDKEVEIKDLDKALAEHRENIIILAQNGVTMPVAGYFSPSDSVTRIQMASFLVRAYEKAETVEVASVEVESQTTLKVKVKEANTDLKVANFDVVVNGKGVVPTAVKADEKGEVYTLTVPTLEDKGEVVVNGVKTAYDFVTVNVTSVNAINATSLKVTGTGLKGLKAEDITVEGNVISTVVASEDGKTATVTLAGVLPVGQESKVSVKTATGTKEFKVSFALEAKTVAIKEDAFDDDTKNQKLTVMVDGINTTVDYLLSSGYSVAFYAYDKNGAPANNVFFGEANAKDPNKTGILNPAGINPEDYTVTLTIAKGSTVLTSAPAKIAVRNLDNNASAISKFTFVNSGADKDHAATTDNYTQNSKTLVIGEQAFLGLVTLGVGSSANEIPGTSSVVELKSSNEAVVSVNANNELVAEGIGNAKITITVGKATQTFDVTVTGVARKSTKVAATATKVVVGDASGVGVIQVFDQYGDPFVGATTLESVLPTSVTGFSSVASAPITTNSRGVATIALDASNGAVAGQSGTVIIRDTNSKTTVGSFVVSITANDALAKTKLVYKSGSESRDDIINAELASDDTILYELENLTSENVSLGTVADLKDYVVKFNGKVISVNADVSGEYTATTGVSDLLVKINGAGSTTLAIYDPNGRLVDQKTITVQQSSTKITGVAWKSVPLINFSTTIDYKTVLDVTEAATGKDPVVKGITLSSPTAYPIRISTNAVSSPLANGDIYIDLNNDGLYDAGETLLGKLTYTSTSNSTGAIANLPITPGTTGTSVSVGTAPAKGYVTFQITDETSADVVKPVVSTKPVQIDVK